MSIIGETATVAWGYTMADLDRLTHRAIAASMRYGPVEFSDRWDAAWYGIVEQLYASAELPGTEKLINAGCDAVQAVAQANLRAHGVNHHTGEIRPRFEQYWGPVVKAVDDGFTDSLIDRLALFQALAVLTPVEYETLATLAVHGSPTAAATALGVSRSTFANRLMRARRHFLEVWYAPESPRAKPASSEACRNGHSRDEHCYRDDRGVWRCRICSRNLQRRAYARVRTASTV